MTTAEYSLTAEALLSFGRNPLPHERIFVRWAAFADKVGPSILPFIIRPDRLDTVPFGALGMTPVKLSDMVPQPGEMWVLFCFKDSFRDAVASDSPLRADGFPLVLEWRREQEDSELLSRAFHDLAGRVREQFGEEGKGWGLHPAFDRYGDAIAFTDSELFSDAENSLQVASAWGALAAGLHCCIAKKFPGVWPFPSIQWDWERKKTAGVAGLAQKISVAADCGATTVTVSPEQMKGAAKTLRELKKGKEGGRFRELSLYAAKDAVPVDAVAEDIAWGALRRKRRRRILSVVNVLIALALAGLFFWQYRERGRAIQQQQAKASQEKVLAIRRQQIEDLRIASLPRELQDSDIETAFNDFDVLRSNFDLPESQAIFKKQLSLRNWLVPIDIRSLEDSSTDFTNSCLRCEKQVLRSGAVSARQFWVPFDFPVSYVHHGIALEAQDVKTRTVLWYKQFHEENKEKSRKETLERPAKIIESWRVNLSGRLGVAEVVTVVGSTNSVKCETVKHELVAKDPFSGKDLWRQRVSSEITAFSFSNNGQRFAFALSDGSVFLKECDTGASVTLPRRFGAPVQALAFSDDDAVLHVKVGDKDISLGIVWQFPVSVSVHDGSSFLDGPIEVREAQELSSLLIGTGIPDAKAIDDCSKCSGGVGMFMRYSLKRPSCRTINVCSTVSVSNKVEELSNGSESDCSMALKLLPDACRPLTEWWVHTVSEIARGNMAARLNCPLTDRRLEEVHFEDDPQATWYGEFILRYALRRHPDDAKTKEKTNRIFLKRTRRTGIVPTKKDVCMQSESDKKSKELWRKAGYVIFQYDKHQIYREEIDFKRRRNDDNHAPLPDDDAIELWGKMVRLMKTGTEAGAMRCLDAYAKMPASVEDEGERELFVPAVRQFIKERKKRNVEGGFVVMRFKPPATSHATFRIGDIVIAVNGMRNVSRDDYIRLKRESNENCELEILRYNPSTQTFDELKVPLAKGQCQVMTRDLAERK